MASASDKLRKWARKFVGQIGSGGVSDAVVTTIPMASTTNLPTDTAITLVIDRVDSAGTKTPTLEETIVGVVSGTNIVNCIRGAEGTAQSHNAGAVVELLVTATEHNDLIDHLLVEHLQSGVHASWVVTASDTQTLTNKTLTSPTLTTPKFADLGYIADANGNELVIFDTVASAVNEFTYANAATGASPTITMSGETNVGLDVKMKGTGKMRKPTVVGIQVFDAGTDTATGDAKAFFRVPEELNGMNLTGVSMSVYTAGTTGTTDVQIRNKTDSVDMLSTKLTIDSGETDTSTAATAAVIDTTKDDVVTGDILAIDVDAVSTTKAKGLYVQLRFELP